MSHANRFRDPVVRPKVALVGIAITLSVWFVVFGCAGLVRSCGSRETSAPRSATDRGAPAPSVPETFVVTQTEGFVEIPTGVKRVVVTIREVEWTPWIELPRCDWAWSENIQFPLLVQRFGENEPLTVKNREQNVDIPGQRLRLRGKNLTTTIHLAYR